MKHITASNIVGGGGILVAFFYLFIATDLSWQLKTYKEATEPKILRLQESIKAEQEEKERLSIEARNAKLLAVELKAANLLVNEQFNSAMKLLEQTTPALEWMTNQLPQLRKEVEAVVAERDDLRHKLELERAKYATNK